MPEHPYNPELPYRERAEIYPMRRGSILTGLIHGGKIPATFGGGVDPGETDFGEVAARELLEETGYKARNVRPAGVDPITMEWDDNIPLSDKQKERRKDFRGERTHLYFGDVYDKVDPIDPSTFQDIRFRRPSTLLKLIQQHGKDNIYQKTHSDVFNRLMAKKSQHIAPSVLNMGRKPVPSAYDWDTNYGKRFKLVQTPADQIAPGQEDTISVVTPANGAAWNWPELPAERLAALKKQWPNMVKGLAPHKRHQIETGEYASAEQVKKSQHILVSGHSGAGKSTLAQALSEKLNMPMVALDKDPLTLLTLMDPGRKFSPKFLAAAKLLRRQIAMRALEKTTPSIIEGTHLITLPNKTLANYPDRVIVDAPKEQILQQRLERQKQRALNKKEEWSPEAEAISREVGEKVYNIYDKSINRYKNLPGTHVWRPNSGLDDLLKALNTKQSNYTLYRGVKSEPLPPNPAYKELVRRALNGELNPKEQRELQALARLQRAFFTPDKALAERYLDPKGQLLSLNLDDKDLDSVYADYNNLGKPNQSLVVTVPPELAAKAQQVKQASRPTVLLDAINTLIDKDKGLNKELADKYKDQRVVVVTNAPEANIKRHLGDYPFEVFTRENNPRKTDPDYYRQLLAHLKLQPSDISTYIEHNPEALAAAAQAGLTGSLHKQAVLDTAVIENPRGSYKQFRDPNDPNTKNYPLEGVTYPTDYGYIPGYTAEDEAELDVFRGKGKNFGFMRVNRPDVKGNVETKVLANVSKRELKDILKAFKPVLAGDYEPFDAAQFIDKIKQYKNKQANYYHGSTRSDLDELRASQPNLGNAGVYAADNLDWAALYALAKDRRGMAVRGGSNPKLLINKTNALAPEGYVYEFASDKVTPPPAEDPNRGWHLPGNIKPLRKHIVKLVDHMKNIEQFDDKEALRKRWEELRNKNADHTLVHYSRNKYDTLRPLSYDELSKSRSRGRWENKPDEVAKYIRDRKNLENYLRRRLKTKGIDYDKTKSFLYATIDGREQFGSSDEIKHEAALTPDIVNQSFFDVVGLPKSRTAFGQKGLDSAIKRWDENKDQLKPSEYMGMTIKPRIEVITPASIKALVKASNHTLVHYSRNKHDTLRPLSYEELSKDRANGRWENKPDLVAKYVHDRKIVENYLRRRLKAKGIDYDKDKSFLYATLDGREQFGTPGSIKHEAPLTPDIINQSFFSVAGLPKGRVDKVYGQRGLDSAIKRWDENKEQLKPSEYMGMTIRPRIEIITPASIKALVKASSQCKAAYGGGWADKDRYTEYDRYYPVYNSDTYQDLLDRLHRSNDIATKNKQKLSFYSARDFSDPMLTYADTLKKLKSLGLKPDQSLHNLPPDTDDELPWFYQLEYPTAHAQSFNKKNPHPVHGNKGYAIPVVGKDKVTFREIKPKAETEKPGRAWYKNPYLLAALGVPLGVAASAYGGNYLSSLLRPDSPSPMETLGKLMPKPPQSKSVFE